ncbi:hypothetical protein DM01DRAFT_1334744 [Hesseltinella vesiculosa]|uniref:RNI-like protein n=1 Tax=Hesseltinella vesiculosa TaxID=101127 RepID=A0A1X2GKZ7_9FUNG|nr:hypothetical protein DM01DRAFT_1334744 [Hesseltinella vesiculosa]
MTNPRQCVSFLTHLPLFEQRGYMDYVRQLDLSSYTVHGSGWSEASAKDKITAAVLARWILACRRLQQLVVGDELMYTFLDPVMMQAVFTAHHRFLQVIDLAGFCDQRVTQAMADLLENKDKKDENGDNDLAAFMPTSPSLQHHRPLGIVGHPQMPGQLTQLSFHKCMALSPTRFFQPLFEQLQHHHLTRLDLAYTPVTNHVLSSLHPEKLTHLNLQACRSLYCHRQEDPPLGLGSFLSRCVNLVELNLNIQFNGSPMRTQFCRHCLTHWILHDLPKMQQLRVLDLGGQGHIDDDLLAAMPLSILRQLRYLSLACVHLSYPALQSALGHMKQLEYLNVTRVRSLQGSLPALLMHCATKLPRLVVIEGADHRKAIAIPPSLANHWFYHENGRRGYYARANVDPRFKYSQKLLLLDQQPQSPMLRYWCFS